jgi:hypothetical protein
MHQSARNHFLLQLRNLKKGPPGTQRRVEISVKLRLFLVRVIITTKPHYAGALQKKGAACGHQAGCLQRDAFHASLAKIDATQPSTPPPQCFTSAQGWCSKQSMSENRCSAAPWVISLTASMRFVWMQEHLHRLDCTGDGGDD